MGSGKTMLVSEMAQAVLKEDAPVCIEAFDGSTFGPEDADLQVRVTSPKAIYQLASNLNEIGLARAYILGYFDIEGLDVADPYPQLRKLVELASYIRKPSPLELARMGAAVLSHGEYLTRWGPGLLRLGAIMSFGGYCVSRPGLLRLGAVVG